MGDDVQMSKAGLMEIGDIYVVNKGDLEGADLMVVRLLSLVRTLKSRSPQIVKVSALTGEGLDQLDAALGAILSKFGEGDREIRMKSIKGMVTEIAKGDVVEGFLRRSGKSAEALAEQVLEGRLTIVEAAAKLASR
jgi:LAO/AO transport system kinase